MTGVYCSRIEYRARWLSIRPLPLPSNTALRDDKNPRTTDDDVTQHRRRGSVTAVATAAVQIENNARVVEEDRRLFTVSFRPVREKTRATTTS